MTIPTRIVVLVATTIATIAVALSLAVAGCSSAKPAAEVQRAECVQNMALMHVEIGLFQADTGEYPPLADVVDKMHMKCPSGGTYALDPNTGVLSCSVHGPY